MPEITDAEFWRLFDSRLQAVTDDAYLAAFNSGARAGVALLGGAAEALVDWDVINDAATAFLAQNRLSTAAMTEITRRRVVSEFIEWQRSGKPLKNLISRIQPWFGKLRAKRIAITETTRAYAYGNLTAWQSSGLVSAKRWYTARDERVCPLCGPMHGQIVVLDQNFRIVEEALPPKLRGKYAPVYAPPLHVNCVLPGNVVYSPGGISAASKSFYIGGAVEIGTSSGRVISVTKNHPILTGRGWVAAGLIDETDYLFNASLADRIVSSVNPYNQDAPSVIEEVFGSIVKSKGVSSARVPVAPEYFHGDGRNLHGNIDIVNINRLLLDNSEPGLSNTISNHVFGGGYSELRVLRSDSASDSFVNACNTTAGGVVRGANLIGSLFSGHPRPLDSLGLGLVARSIDAMSGEEVSDGEAADTSLAREYILRNPGKITIDPVVRIRKFDYSGHVYDLQNDLYGLYTCNDIITHNCRCYLQPVTDKALLDQQLKEALR